MPLGAGCPRCPAPVTQDERGWRCSDHGPITPLWRPAEADYESFADHVTRAGAMPTYVPWPLAPGWAVTDFGCVASPGRDGRATVLSVSGLSDADGVVEVSVVAEEPGVGLGSRCAGLSRTDPGGEIGDGPPPVKVRLGVRPVSLWSVLTSDADVTFDRSVFVGEAEGRWLWLVLRPASAALLLQAEWILMDVADLSPALVEVPFGTHPPAW